MARGDGWLHFRNGVWYAWWYHAGRKVKRSLKTADPAVAERRLVALRRQRERGEYQPRKETRDTVADLLDDVLVHLEVHGRASLAKAKSHAKAVRDDLGHVLARDLDTARIERAAQAWLRAGRARATVNRRLELLGRAYRLAAHRTPPKVRTIPFFSLLSVDNARRGFIEHDEIARLLPHLEPDLRDFAEWCYAVGMRKGEASRLTWPMLDQTGPRWLLRIPAELAKNREGRALPVVGLAREVLDRRKAVRRLDTPLIFHRRWKARGGQPIKAFDIAWRNALRAAGLPADRLFHDLRRSAARNLRLAGATETEAMRVTGHKTASMFRRYSIVTDDDAAAALEKQERFLGRGTVTKTATTPKR